MPKIKLTKGELKRQRDGLAQFRHYLPTLQLKKQQLQVEISKIIHAKEEMKAAIDSFWEKLDSWISVFGEEVDIRKYIKADKISLVSGNIAGIEIPVYEGVKIKENPCDSYDTPLWMDKGIEAVKNMVDLKAKLLVLEKQSRILNEELRITTQRVNLFEKVKIPQTRENIRVIRVFLGDLFTAEVVRGKIAKAKLEKAAQK